MKNVKVVGIQGFPNKEYYLLHVIRDPDPSNVNLVGSAVENVFVNSKLMPAGLKVNDYVGFVWDNVRGKAYLQAVNIIK